MTPPSGTEAAEGPGASDPQSALTGMADVELLALWSSVMHELNRRGKIRSSNNPVADIAERLVADRLGLMLVDKSMAGFDAVAPDGTRYQIKARRLLTPKTSRQLGALRGLDGDSFDQLIMVLLGPAFELLELWQLPIDLVREHAKYRAHVNAHVLHARGAVLRDSRAVQLT